MTPSEEHRSQALDLLNLTGSSAYGAHRIEAAAVHATLAVVAELAEMNERARRYELPAAARNPPTPPHEKEARMRASWIRARLPVAWAAGSSPPPRHRPPFVRRPRVRHPLPPLPPRKENAPCCSALRDDLGRLPIGFCGPSCIRRPGVWAAL